MRIGRGIPLAQWSLVALWLPLAAVACSSGHILLLDQAEARRLATELRAEFARGNEAANRAVMAENDDASKAAAIEATQATAAVDQTLNHLTPILQSLNYSDELKIVDAFTRGFDELKTIDAEVLSLAVENTNLKAQRLSFTTAREAADAFVAAVSSAASASSAPSSAKDAAAAATIAILKIQVIQPRHIAEADDAPMTAMEQQMKDLTATARAEVRQLGAALPPSAHSRIGEASASLENFLTINQQIIELSRRNTNVRSLALTLGRKRVIGAQCTDQLRLLEETLGQHQFKATR